MKNLKLKWLIPDQVLDVQITGQFSGESLIQADEQVTQALNSSPQTVHVVLDLRRAHSLPPIRTLQRLNWLQHDQLGHVVTVGLDSFPQRMALRIVKNILSIETRAVDTEQDALHYIASIDDTIDLPERYKILREPSVIQQCGSVHRGRSTV